MSEFVHSLVCVSEKAANIARACRQEETLFSLLIQEKTGEEKNQRFVQDFKTLADVLIQETVLHDIGQKFPEIADHIKGEESKKFTNALGDSICVEVKESEEETKQLLSKVLGGNSKAASLLATEVHREVVVAKDDKMKQISISLPAEKLGIWIDPIDSTAEYINGSEEDSCADQVYFSGLHCVTVLIGAYERATGTAVLGIINQPFYTKESSLESRWQGLYLWGFNYHSYSLSSLDQHVSSDSERKTIVMSSSESEALKTALEEKYTVLYVAGAGYKLMCVALGLADGYILSKGSTFFWDSCAPHGLLRSIGGGVVDYKKALVSEVNFSDLENLEEFELRYHTQNDSSVQGIEKWCNSGGLIAFRDVHFLSDIIHTIGPCNGTTM